MIIIYHSYSGYACKDGFTAAWVFQRKYPNARLVPQTHNSVDPPPDVTGEDVVIVDYSYKQEILLEMKAKAKSLIVLDHHVSAQKDLEGLDFCHFDMNKSGAHLAWEYCYPDKPVPNLIQYVEDRDLWRWALPNSEEVNSAIASYPCTLEQWDVLILKNTCSLVEEGQAILRYQKQQIEGIVRQARDIKVCGHVVPCVNSSVLLSEVGHVLCEGRPFSVVRMQMSDGRWKYSLRSTDEGLDVSTIAKQLGGGGHRNAAGFVRDMLEDILGE